MMVLSKPLIITGALVLDPDNQIESMQDVFIKNGIIEAVDKPGSFDSVSDAEVITAKTQLLTPGLVDLHVHLREPGQEWKETIATGATAAVAGGFTDICCMPNTKPVNDSREVTELIIEQAARAGLCKVHPVGAITMGLKGESLAPMLELREAGCVAFSDDGHTIGSAIVMRKALEYSKITNAVIAVHEEDASLSRGFSMNESAISAQMGLVGMPDAAENIMIARDIELSRYTGAPVHFCHVSNARAVELIRRAKADGIPVTAEVAPHHFVLDDSAIGEFDTNYKMSMPLRNKQDRNGLLAGLADGTIDCIASDHAPHDLDSKRCEFDKAAFGIIGLQTTLPLTLAKVKSGAFSLNRAIDSLTSAPRRCFGLKPIALKAGSSAELTLIDLERTVVFDESMNQSKSNNSPFLGKKLTGVAVKTIVQGRVVFDITQVQ